MSSTTTKRPAPRDTDGPPSKRRATSSPEEGELDDSSGTSPVRSGSFVSTPPVDANQKFKVPFPFKNKNSLLSRIEGPSRSSTDRYEYSRELGRGRDDEGQERNQNRSAVIYDRYDLEDRHFHQDNVAYARDRRARGAGVSKRDVTGDHYKPAYAPDAWGSRHSGSRHDPSRDRDYDRRQEEREGRFASHRETDPTKLKISQSPVRPDSPATVSRDYSRSRSASPQDLGRSKRRHRLPTPRSTSFTLSPPHDNDLYERAGRFGDHYEPYNEPYSRDTYRDRVHDPRGQYHREEFDDYDRHYRPIMRGQSSFHRSRTPFRPSTPLGDVNITSDAGLPPSPPSLRPVPSPKAEKDMFIEPGKEEVLRAHEAVSFALRRPGAPRNLQSPPSSGCIKKSTPTPPVADTVHPSRETPVVVATKPKRVPVKRTREQEKTAYQRIFIGCGNRDDYDVMTKLGEGTFGEVHKALHKRTGAVVALKRILMHNEKEGIPVTALREIKILKALEHPCIVDLLDMYIIQSKGKDSPISVYMVFPYMDHDLAGLLENERVKLSPSQIKLYMKQLLEGTEYMHHNSIVHRDMKAANLLISNNGSLKIADFGLARAFDSSEAGRDRRYTNCVVTRWYRPPELLLGARHYGGEIDIWGIGCVLGEMIMRRPILPGTSDLDQLDKIWSICGSPNQQNWPDYDKLPGCGGQIRFKPQERRIRQVYDSLGKETCELMDRLLTLDPRERITASDALDHEYFWSDPLPADPKSLPTYEASHEFDQRGRRHQPPMQNDPPVRHDVPPMLQNRNFRNDDAHRHVIRDGAAPSYGSQNGFKGNVSGMTGMPSHTSLAPYHHLPMAPSQNLWASNSRNVATWGSDFVSGPSFGDRRQQPSQLPPRPPGLPPRPEGLSQPLARRAVPKGIPPWVRGTPSNDSLNYGIRCIDIRRELILSLRPDALI
ncbi:BUR1 [Sanghuangporus sanghuang]